jgi:hypothetical protein
LSNIQVVRDAFAAVRNVSDLRRAKRLASCLDLDGQRAIADSWIEAVRRIGHVNRHKAVA